MMMRRGGARKKVRIPALNPKNRNIEKCVYAVNAVEGQIKKAAVSMSQSAAAILAEAKNSSCFTNKASHFLNTGALTTACNERKYNKIAIDKGELQTKNSDGSTPDLDFSKFIYQSNVIYNTTDKGKTDLIGKYLMFGYDNEPEKISSGIRSDFKQNIYESENPTAETTRYKSVIFPLEDDKLKIALKAYLGEYDINVDDYQVPIAAEVHGFPAETQKLDGVYSRLNKMTKNDSTIKWTSDPVKTFVTSDYCTSLCAVYGGMHKIDKYSSAVLHSLKIYRKIITTALKESNQITKGNIVLCEEVIIQVIEKDTGGSNARKRGKCLILTARTTGTPAMHFQGLNAFTVEMHQTPVKNPDSKSRVFESMFSAGWLLAQINNATSNDNGKVKSAAVFFNDLLESDSVKNTSKVLYERRLKKRDKNPNDTDEVKIYTGAIKPITLENSFIAHQRSFLIHPGKDILASVTREWHTGPSFSIIVFSTLGDRPSTYVFVQTYSVFGNENIQDILDRDEEPRDEWVDEGEFEEENESLLQPPSEQKNSKVATPPGKNANSFPPIPGIPTGGVKGTTIHPQRRTGRALIGRSGGQGGGAGSGRNRGGSGPNARSEFPSDDELLHDLLYSDLRGVSNLPDDLELELQML